MSTNKQALREAAREEIRFREEGSTSEYWAEEANPATVLALLDELEAAGQTIATQQLEIRNLLNALNERAE